MTKLIEVERHTLGADRYVCKPGGHILLRDGKVFIVK